MLLPQDLNMVATDLFRKTECQTCPILFHSDKADSPYCAFLAGHIADGNRSQFANTWKFSFVDGSKPDSSLFVR